MTRALFQATRLATFVFLAFIGRPFSAESTTNPALPPVMPREQEIKLAMSAGPESIAKDATIYVLERGPGLVVARKGTNGFACMVERTRPDTLEPECFDPEGVESMVPRFVEMSRLVEQGLGPDDVRKKIAEGFASGKFRAPRRPGITYMLYPENRVFNGESVITYGPHIMVFAPYLKNTDIGADMKDPALPWVLNEGSPHAYIIMKVGNGAAHSH